MRKQPVLVTFVVIIVLSSQIVLANNNYFLAGDAFFHSTINQDQAKELAKPSVKPRIFAYSFYGAEFDLALCGYAGYSHAIIPDVDDNFSANLAAVYSSIRSTYTRQWDETGDEAHKNLIETNPIHVFFYKANYDFKKSNVGLRYNENWVSEVLKFGHNRAGARLCCFISGEEPVTISWRDSKIIAGLNVALPEVAIVPGKAISKPLTITGSIKAIVLPPIALSKLFTPDNTQDLYIVDSSGIEHLMYDNIEKNAWIKY